MQAVGDGEGRTAVPALVHAHDAAAPADPAVDKVDGVRVRQRHLDEEIVSPSVRNLGAAQLGW
jgi:hypothetical protein